MSGKLSRFLSRNFISGLLLVVLFVCVVFARLGTAEENKFFCLTEDGGTYVENCKECSGTCVSVKDDWKLDKTQFENKVRLGGSAWKPRVGFKGKSLTMATGSATENLGLQVGGKKGFDNFCANIKAGYTPLPESISYEGVFYEHYFDISSDEECPEIMCPVLRGMNRDDKKIVAYGLKSGVKVADYKRPHLNLVVVLDISGSMNGMIDAYYYDLPHLTGPVQDCKREAVFGKEGQRVPKIEVAKDVLIGLIEKLEPTDRFGLVLFESQAYVAKPLRLVGATDIEAIKKHIKEDIMPLGGTNFEAGILKAIEVLKAVPKDEVHGPEWETRVLIITDAMPNLGDFSAHGLGRYIKGLAEKHIHTTVVGVGVDFNYRLMDIMNDIEGGNIFSVKSADEFKKLLNEEFEYVFFPLYYDLYATLDMPGYYISRVIGSDLPEGSATKYVIRVKTLFPAKTTEEGGKGSIVLVVMEPVQDETARAGWLKSTVSLRDRAWNLYRKRWHFREDEVFASPPHPDLEKAVILVEFVDLMKEWTDYVRKFGCRDVKDGMGDDSSEKKDDWQYNRNQIRRGFVGSPWEQTSVALCVPSLYVPQIKEVYRKMTDWEKRHGKTEFSKEKEVLELLLSEASQGQAKKSR